MEDEVMKKWLLRFPAFDLKDWDRSKLEKEVRDERLKKYCTKAWKKCNRIFRKDCSDWEKVERGCKKLKKQMGYFKTLFWEF